MIGFGPVQDETTERIMANHFYSECLHARWKNIPHWVSYDPKSKCIVIKITPHIKKWDLIKTFWKLQQRIIRILIGHIGKLH